MSDSTAPAAKTDSAPAAASGAQGYLSKGLGMAADKAGHHQSDENIAKASAAIGGLFTKETGKALPKGF